MAVVLADVLDAKLVLLDLQASTREDALREIVASMEGGGKLRDAEKFLAEVVTRERSTTTYVGNGVAFPHARTELVANILLGIARSRGGVEFGEAGERAHLIFLIAVPRRMVTDYLICVGALARLTRDEKTRAKLMEATDAAEFVAVLREGSLLLE
ncbi:MAG: PTS sugar transporter subunit IIA [Verrucomicrobiota bacterium]|nr:PTS sugar transporter subunit IIA [Verrucomicrobiota bacterium]